jgi:tRNA threonylcarbamoyladenosine biosynthesis protein TsaB
VDGIEAVTILTIRTDKPESEIGLYEDKKQLAYETWEAHRQLAETVHIKIEELLKKSNKDLDGLDGIVCFKGPGSFTGLRIGLSVANTLAYSLGIPIVGSENPDWLEKGTKGLLAGQNDKVALPEYGAPARTTKPRK